MVRIQVLVSLVLVALLVGSLVAADPAKPERPANLSKLGFIPSSADGSMWTTPMSRGRCGWPA